jgi:arylsulfatase A-like enzyme
MKAGLVIGTCLAFVALILSQSNMLWAQDQNDRPNILLILADDIGFSDIAPFGGEISTPNIESLAKDGQLLTNFHVLPACSPSRSEILTGVDNHLNGLGTMFETITPNQIGKDGYETYLNDKVITVADILNDVEYHTIFSGKWHLSNQYPSQYMEGQYISEPSTKGFEHSFALLEGGAHHFNDSSLCDTCYPPTFLKNGNQVDRPEGVYSSDLYTDEMLSFVSELRDENKPLFMYLAFQAPHSPLEADEQLINKYLANYTDGWEQIREERFENGKRIGIWPADMKMPERFPPDPEWNGTSARMQDKWIRNMTTHAAMVENLDFNVGRLIKYLKEIGQYENTLILFASDNGGSNPTLGMNTVEVSPFSGGKGSMYDGGIRSPLVVKEPIDSGTSNRSANVKNSGLADSKDDKSTYKIINSFIHALDLFPTFVDYAKVDDTSTKIPSILETFSGALQGKKEIYEPTGKSIRPVLEGNLRDLHGDKPMSQELFGNSAVFMKDWKALRHNPPAGNGQWELYNISFDPGERNNLAKEHPEILKNLIASYDEYSESNDIVPPDPSHFPTYVFGTLPKFYD